MGFKVYKNGCCPGDTWNLKVSMSGDGGDLDCGRGGTRLFCSLGDSMMLMVTDTDEILGMF